jgi:hypothetical protein
MHQAVGVILLIVFIALAVVVAAAFLASWLEPGAQTLRALTKILGAPPEVSAIAAVRSQGAALRVAEGRLAVVRGPKDTGLIYDLDELVGVELIFDNQVAARMYRGEPRRPLDHIAPAVRRVMLRLAFDDLRYPDFELELLNPADFGLKQPPDPEVAVQEGRRWFARLEAVLRRTGSPQALTR